MDKPIAALLTDLKHRDQLISDPVQDYDGNLVGAFLDSEGNKLWFCSGPKE